MKCASPYPDGSYQECQEKLGHSGQHTYPGLKWPRLEPAELDMDIEILLDRAARQRNVWDLNDREYPVVIERTLTYVLWVDADSEDSALKSTASDSWEISLSKETPTDCSDEVRRLDEFERPAAFEAEGMQTWIGPEIACPDCARTAFRREWYHDPFRRCHGPIVWMKHPGAIRAYRQYNATPVHGAARQAVSA